MRHRILCLFAIAGMIAGCGTPALKVPSSEFRVPSSPQPDINPAHGGANSAAVPSSKFKVQGLPVNFEAPSAPAPVQSSELPAALSATSNVELGTLNFEQSVSAPPFIYHLFITGPEADILTVPPLRAWQGSNYLFEVLGTSNLLLPINQWSVTYPPGWTNGNFWVTNTAPAEYFSAEFQPGPQPGSQ